MKKLITFDLDNTLWDVDPVIVRAEYAMEAWFDKRVPGFMDVFTPLYRQTLHKQLITDFPSLVVNITALRAEMYKQALKAFGFSLEESDVVAKSAITEFSKWRQKVDLYPYVRNVLEILSKEYRLVAITNGNADVFNPIIGLAAYFDFSVRADLVDIAKPDPKLFEIALKKAGVDYTRMVHVGDHPINDIAGASAASVKSIWFNRHGARSWREEWGTRADVEVHSLLELPEVVKHLL